MTRQSLFDPKTQRNQKEKNYQKYAGPNKGDIMEITKHYELEINAPI